MSEMARSRTFAAAMAPHLSPAYAARLLAELQQAHAELLDALAVLERLTGRPSPDPDPLANARWRLSLASRKRRSATAMVCAELLGDLSPGEAAAIDGLLAEGARQLSQSAAHVRKWTTAGIAADWRGYCAASAVLRGTMRIRIAAEQGILYPLLEKHSR